MKPFVLVALGGAAGTLCRHGIAELVPHDDSFPVATFVVNVAGSFALGILVAAWLGRPAEQVRLLLGTGFLGGFTTYSALAVETESLLRTGQVALGLTYAGGSVLAGVAAALAGVAAGSGARR